MELMEFVKEWWDCGGRHDELLALVESIVAERRADADAVQAVLTRRPSLAGTVTAVGG